MATPDAAAEGPSPEPSSRGTRTRRKSHASIHHGNTVKRASFWLLAIAALQLVFGAFVGQRMGKEADRAQHELARFEPEETLEVDGETRTVARLREQIERERLQAYVLPIGLGVVFFALFFWAQRAPLPAFGTALALFVTAHALEAVMDPTALLRGWIFKALAIAGLAGGLKSALALHAAPRREAAAG